LDDLKAGRIAEWSYGFSAVRIYPPQKVFDAYEQGIQEGMKRERALWLMQAEGQKIEQPRPVQVSAIEFAKAVHGKESLVGQPTMWAEWPCKEQS
jgi:hypothetical protein